MKACWTVVTILGLSGPALADEIIMKGGGRISGSVVARSNSTITIETGPGTLTLPLERIEKVTEGQSALSAYQQRADSLRPDDANGWLELGLWARERGLATQARQAFERAAQLDPSSSVAQEALGNVEAGGRWVSQDEAQRLRGNVLFEGVWMTPTERDDILARRQAAVRAEQSRLEADARVREAEARARQAEAEARRAEGDSNAGSPAEGVEVPWWLLAGSADRHRSHRGHHEADRGRSGERGTRHATDGETARPGTPSTSSKPQAAPTPAPVVPAQVAPVAGKAASSAGRSR